jgi:hypothetical protein
MRYEEWQYGKKYSIALAGDIMVRRERGVSLGDVRVFQHSRALQHDTEVKYYAELDFPSIIPFRAPVIWWRKINE